MTWEECLTNRRSVRRFTDKEVSNEVIEKLITLASYAPSWKNSQSVRYIVVKDKQHLQNIANDCVMDFSFNQKTILQTPVLILVTTLKHQSGYEPDTSYSTSKGSHWESFDAGVASQTLSLAAHGLGLGSVILGIYDEQKVLQTLEIQDDVKVSAMIALGYPLKPSKMPKRVDVKELYSYK